MLIVWRMEKKYLALAGGLFIGGILALALGVIRGEVTAGIAIFIPFLFGTGPFASLGVLLVFLGMLALFFAFFSSSLPADAMEDEDEDGQPGQRGPEQEAAGDGSGTASSQHRPRTNVRGGAVIMIGPIPIVLGSDPAMTRTLMILALALMAAAIILMVVVALG
jgi:uncharacterized protein (TIGR00304 family)